MTIDEAMEILNCYMDSHDKDDLVKFDKAIELGIEAMTQVKFYRSIPDGKRHNLLPGETEEIVGRDKFGKYTYEQNRKGGKK